MAHVPIALPRRLIRELLTVVAVVVVSAVVGYFLGIALNHAFGTPKPPEGSARRSVPSQAATATPAGSATTTTAAAVGTVPGRTTLDLGDSVTLRITSATFVAATTPAGKVAKRGRLAVVVSVKNAGTTQATVPLAQLVVRAAGAAVRPDPDATEAAGDLSQPVAPGATATGELRFETSGAATTELDALDKVALRFGPQALTTAVS
jgi:hypothetical protein